MMKQVNNRKTELMKYIQPYMEEYFQISCTLIQKDIERNGEEIWSELKNILYKLFIIVKERQTHHKKRDLQYLNFNFLQSGIYTSKFELCIDALDDGFYLDKQETALYYCPCFLQEKYQKDICGLLQQAESKFIRLQEYELVEIKKQYTAVYDCIVYEWIKSLAKLILQEVVRSSVGITDKFMLIYGKYMDEAIILCTKEKFEDEILFNRNR